VQDMQTRGLALRILPKVASLLKKQFLMAEWGCDHGR